MTALTIETGNAQNLSGVKAFLKAMNLAYSATGKPGKDKPYNPEFVAKILKADREGETVSMTLEEFRERYLS